MDHSESTFTSPSKKKKTLVPWAEYPSKSPDLFAGADPGHLAKRLGSFLALPAVRVAMVTTGRFHSRLRFDDAVVELEEMETHHVSGASVRLAKTPKLDKDGCLSFRTFLRWEYSESAEFGNSQWHAALVHVCRDQTFVFLRNSTHGAVNYHPRCPYISFFSGSKSAESFEQ